MNKFASSRLDDLTAMEHKILYDKNYFEPVLLDLTINITEMFKDPSFYFAV